VFWLVAVLWGVYVSECVVRHRAGTLMFRGLRPGALRAATEPDLDLFDGRLGLSWTTILPWGTVVMASGIDRDACSAETTLGHAVRTIVLVRTASSVLFGLLLVGLPVLALIDRVSALVLWWAPVLVTVWLATLVGYFRAHHALHGRRPGLEEALTVVLSPLAAVRAPVRLLGSVLRAYSPLAVASVVCAEPDLLALLRQVYFDDERRREEVEALLGERGLTSRFWAAPSGGGAGLRLFCPRCGTMYTGGVTHCVDCRHVELRAVPVGQE
jgi:hypothetical protein